MSADEFPDPEPPTWAEASGWGCRIQSGWTGRERSVGFFLVGEGASHSARKVSFAEGLAEQPRARIEMAMTWRSRCSPT
jgi:hypothetical protein